MTWLITGGAGYIGSHIVELFLESNLEVVVFDNLSTGRKKRISTQVPLIQANILQPTEVKKALENFHISGIINLAALKSVSESLRLPNKYAEVNHQGVKILLECAKESGVQSFIQSPSAAVYGNSASSIVTENSRLHPMSPYGVSKLEAEKEVEKFILNGHGRGVNLRYFNVVGSKNERLRDFSAENLFPIVIEKINRNEPPMIFGNDYPTQDGTCIRDYVHVLDIAKAHLLAAKTLESKQINQSLNLGTGKGYSVIQIIGALLDSKNSKLIPQVVERRIGDPAALIADISLAKLEIDFEAEFGLQDMVDSTYG